MSDIFKKMRTMVSQKKYYETHHEDVRQRQAQYRMNLTFHTVKCEICNGSYRNDNKSRHLKTKKHLQALEKATF